MLDKKKLIELIESKLVLQQKTIKSITGTASYRDIKIDGNRIGFKRADAQDPKKTEYISIDSLLEIYHNCDEIDTVIVEEVLKKPVRSPACAILIALGLYQRDSISQKIQKKKNRTMSQKIKIGIIGGAGYTAGELLRILLAHPHAELGFVYSTTQAGQPVCRTHTDLLGDTELCFTDTLVPVDVLFLCLGHGVSREFLSKHKGQIDPLTKVIDLGNDFRLDGSFEGREFIYGLPEVRRDEISNAREISNPGCFATAIQLALLPLAKAGLLNNEVHINATTGSTGAGRSLSESTHFSNRNGNVSTYKVFSHQHLGEISMTLKYLGQGIEPSLSFIPVRGNFTRGIFSTLYTECSLSDTEANKLYEEYYAAHPFTHIAQQEISLKDVVNTNKCILHVKKYGNKILVTSIIDNLLKGASGQAVQNMNLMFGLDETCGLHLKSLGF